MPNLSRSNIQHVYAKNGHEIILKETEELLNLLRTLAPNYSKSNLPRKNWTVSNKSQLPEGRSGFKKIMMFISSSNPHGFKKTVASVFVIFRNTKIEEIKPSKGFKK